MHMVYRMTLFISVILLLAAGTGSGDSQWRGPQRDGHYPDTGLLQTWPEGGPKLLWSMEAAGEGWGSVSAGPTGRYVVGTFAKKDHLLSLDDKGGIVWKQPYGDQWKKSFPASRCTPTVKDGWVYVTSGAGQVACLSAKTGETRWAIHGVDQFSGSQGPWGITESLLLVDNKVIFTPGGSETTVVALDQETGATVWQSPSLKDNSAYTSPILIEHGGRHVIVTVTAAYIIGVDSEDGTILWRYHYFELPHWEHKMAPYINCISPLYHEGRLFVTSGYDHCAVMLEISEDHSAVKEIWRSREFDTHHGGVVLVDGYLYGSNWESNSMGRWICADWEKGEIQYEHEWENKGSLIYADGRLYCYEEKKGNVALVKPNPKGFERVGTFQVTLGKKQHWAHPSIYDKVLYLRHGEAVMAYDLAKE